MSSDLLFLHKQEVIDIHARLLIAFGGSEGMRGNKRVAAAVTEIFAEINGAVLEVSDDEIVTLFLNIAEGKLSRLEVEHIISRWMVV